MQKEYQRQREYLEKTVASLRRKLQKEGEQHRHDNVKVMQENMALIDEINSLRRELKLLKQAQKEKVFLSLLFTLLVLTMLVKDLSMSRTHSPKASLLRSTNSVGDGQVVVDSTRIIEMQKEEIKRQRARISELEVFVVENDVLQCD